MHTKRQVRQLVGEALVHDTDDLALTPALQLCDFLDAILSFDQTAQKSLLLLVMRTHRIVAPVNI